MEGGMHFKKVTESAKRERIKVAGDGCSREFE